MVEKVTRSVKVEESLQLLIRVGRDVYAQLPLVRYPDVSHLDAVTEESLKKATQIEIDIRL